MKLHLIALYVGPDQVMPLASILATITGFLLIFWQKVLAAFRWVGKLFKRSGTESPAQETKPSTEEPGGQA